MWPWKKTGSGYLALDKAEAAEETCEPRVPSYKAERPSLSSLFYLCTVALIFLSVGFLCGENLQDNRLIAELSRPNHECSSPSTRREWRSLSTAEKEEYLTAVGCLMAKPSILNLDGSFYDDFSFVHNNIGNYCKFMTLPSPQEQRKCLVFHRLLKYAEDICSDRSIVSDDACRARN